MLVILVLMVQMWVLTATLESFLAGHRGVALPALLSSAVLFGVCAFLYLLVLRHVQLRVDVRRDGLLDDVEHVQSRAEGCRERTRTVERVARGSAEVGGDEDVSDHDGSPAQHL